MHHATGGKRVLTFNGYNVWGRVDRWTTHVAETTMCISESVGQQNVIPVGLNTYPSVSLDDWVTMIDNTAIIDDMDHMDDIHNEEDDLKVIGWGIDEDISKHTHRPRVCLVILFATVTGDELPDRPHIVGFDLDLQSVRQFVASRNDIPSQIIAFNPPDESEAIMELLRTKRALADL